MYKKSFYLFFEHLLSSSLSTDDDIYSSFERKKCSCLQKIIFVNWLKMNWYCFTESLLLLISTVIWCNDCWLMLSDETYSEDSIFSLEGIIIIRQLRRIVKMIVNEKRGWTRMWMATRRTGLNGDKAQMADSAENRKMSFPLLMTINVWKRKGKGKKETLHYPRNRVWSKNLFS